MPLTNSQFQPQFKWEVTAIPGGEQVKNCFDCGTCTGVCPVSASETGFDPRKILHMIKMGLKDQLLSSPAIWQCTHCDTCAFVCPQDVPFSNVIRVLRNMAVTEGYAPVEESDSWRTAPCKAACPAHISIPGFISAISEGRYEEGLRLIKEEMPFPAICGRICPHPCELQCNRGRMDEPVAIEFLKRFLADWDLLREAPYVPEKKPARKEKVAVIGAGPAGLTASYYLAIQGYPVTVLEKSAVAGGMMAVGIPDFRLPRSILEAEIDVIRKLGVEINLNVDVGRRHAFSALQREYDAVFVGIGCQEAMRLGLGGEDRTRGVMDGLAFLKEIHLGHASPARGRLVVIGGGNTAVDCARVARRLNFDPVSILYRRTREEMPAGPWEVEDTLEEDIDIQFLTAPVRILEQEGRVSGLECIRMTLGEPDPSGRRRPIPVEGSQFIVETDWVITALGQRADLSFMPDGMAGTISKDGLLVADTRSGVTSSNGVFAGGDAVSGPRTVVEAVAFGKEAARSIDLYLRGEDMDALWRPDWKGTEYLPQELHPADRTSMPRLSLAERRRTFKEIDLGFSEEQARCEAERCFRVCGIPKTF